MTEHLFPLFRISRKNYVEILEAHTLDQLNTVPVGFKNNLIWNMAHVISATDGLVYRLNGLPVKMPESFKLAYSKGSQPEKAVDQSFVDEIKHLLLNQVDEIQAEYNSGLFPSRTVQEYPTSYGNTLVSIENILEFIQLHEGLHYGYMLALKKLI